MDEDRNVVATINALTGAGLVVTGRAEFGRLGGAIFAEWPDGSPAVVTRFAGSVADAHHAAGVLNDLCDTGLPVPRHQLVVDFGESVAFVQERLRQGPSRRLNNARIDAMVEINDRFAGVLGDRQDLMPALQWCRSNDSHRHDQTIAAHSPRSRRLIAEITGIIAQARGDIDAGSDLVHVDFSPANVLFDREDHAVAVVDWNFGVYRGDRHFALVQTRFDREWFIQSPTTDPVETAAAHYLDEILADRVPPEKLRIYWAYWMLHHLRNAVGRLSSIADWQLDLADNRIH